MVVATKRGVSGIPVSMAFSPAAQGRSRWLAIAHRHEGGRSAIDLKQIDTSGVVSRRDSGAAREMGSLPLSGEFRSMAFSPRGDRIAAVDSQTVRVWSVENGRELFRRDLAADERPLQVVFLDQTHVETVAADGRGRIDDLDRANLLKSVSAFLDERDDIRLSFDEWWDLVSPDGQQPPKTRYVIHGATPAPPRALDEGRAARGDEPDVRRRQIVMRAIAAHAWEARQIVQAEAHDQGSTLMRVQGIQSLAEIMARSPGGAASAGHPGIDAGKAAELARGVGPKIAEFTVRQAAGQGAGDQSFKEFELCALCADCHDPIGVAPPRACRP
jgi:hypothetical protein